MCSVCALSFVRGGIGTFAKSMRWPSLSFSFCGLCNGEEKCICSESSTANQA